MKKNDVEAVKNCLSALNDDRAFLIFPEGHIKTDESDDTFKSGASVIAYMADAPVVPVYIKKRKHWYQRTYVYIGERIALPRVGAMPKMSELKTFDDLINQKINQMSDL